MISSECSRDKTCVNQRCVDPCPGTCGVNARCRVVNHNPICSCNSGYFGDPFSQCRPEESKHVIFFWLCLKEIILKFNPGKLRKIFFTHKLFYIYLFIVACLLYTHYYF